jgi:hypothetical protein
VDALLKYLADIDLRGDSVIPLDASSVASDLRGLGYVDIRGNQSLVRSLSGYTLNKRELALRYVMGSDPDGTSRYDKFLDFVSGLIQPGDSTPKLATWGVPIQPTEKSGLSAVGMRRFWFDIIARALDCMDQQLFENHIRAAYINGIIFARENGHAVQGYPTGLTDYQLMVTPRSDGKPVMPASIPPGYITFLAEYLRGY